MLRTDEKTVRVRVAVVVSDEGDWRAHGVCGRPDLTSIDDCEVEYLSGSGAVATYFIEATLPLPAAETVEADVVEEVREGCEECGDTGLSLNDEGRCGHCEMAEREQRDMDLDREDS